MARRRRGFASSRTPGQGTSQPYVRPRHGDRGPCRAGGRSVTAPSASPWFAIQALLLAHSWAAWAPDCPFEVCELGDGYGPVLDRLSSLGVEVRPA
jgi:hypothetical protein